MDTEPGQGQVAGPLGPNMNDAEDVDGDARKCEAIAKVLRTPVILREIFQRLSNQVLWSVLFINRGWKSQILRFLINRDAFFLFRCLFWSEIILGVLPQKVLDVYLQVSFSIWTSLRQLEHRDVVIDHQNIYATMKERNALALDVIDDFLNSLNMRSSDGKSLCGIYVKLGDQHGYSCQEPSAYELNTFLTKYHNDPQATVLAVHFDRGWDQHQNCPGFKLLKTLLNADRWHIVHFSLLVASKRLLFLRKAVNDRDYEFKHLKKLSFQDVGVYTTSANYTYFIKLIVSCAPNLNILTTRGRVDLSTDLLEELPEWSQAIHIPEYPYSASLDEIPEDATELRMKRMELKGIGEDFSLERFDRITPELLRVSRSTLTRMDIDLPFLLPLAAYGISLDLIHLHIILDTWCFHEFENQNGWNLIKSFDFKRMFPTLRRIWIEHDWESHSRQRNVLNAFMPVVERIHGNVAPDRAKSVRNVSMRWDADLEERSAQALAQTLPNIQRLSIQAKGMIPFQVIWSYWLDLEVLDITLIGAEEDPSLNLDSVFCGIFPEEVDELRKMDDKYLKAVNIVPVMPSITSLRSLDTLILYLEANFHSGPFHEGRPDFLFSKVTPLIAFRKLRAPLETDDEDIEKALSHLKPYVSSLQLRDEEPV